MSTERAPINVILRGGQSGGHIAVMDNVVGAGFPGPPLHHHDFDETFYVLEGEFTFQLEDEVFAKSGGELAFAPRNVAHTIANLSGTDARVDRIHAGGLRALLRPDVRRAGRLRSSPRPSGHGPR